MEPATSTRGIPSILGLRIEAEARLFIGGSSSVKIRCLADVGSRRFEAEKHVLMAHVNNQRLSAGDLRGSVKNTSSLLRLNLVLLVVLVFTTT